MFGCCAHFDQVLDLGPHDVLAADRPVQHRLVDDHPQAGRVRPGQDLLPGHPQRDPLLDLRRSGRYDLPSWTTARAYSSVCSRPGTNITS